MTAAGLTCVLLQEALDEIRHVLQNQAESLQAKFKDMDKDGNGCIDVHEWTAALQQLGVDMPKPRAERTTAAHDSWISLLDMTAVYHCFEVLCV